MTRSLLLVLLLATPAAAGPLPEPFSYTHPVPGGKYLFVMLGNAAEETGEKTPPDKQAQFRELRAKYPKTGLYTAAGELVWAVEDQGFAPYDNVFPAGDGVHFVRVEGDWWRTARYTAAKRLDADAEAAQLAAPAVSFFARGKLLRTHHVRDLVTAPAELPHTPQHLLWKSDAALHEDAGRFVVFTHDSNRVAFDYRTGDIEGRSKAGLGNPTMKSILAATAVLTVLVLGAWVYFALLRKPRG